MACVPGLKAYTKTVTKAPITGRDGSGDPTFGAQTTISAYVERISKKVRSSDGNELEANHRIISPDAIDIADRLWLPGDTVGDVTQGRRILDLTATPNIRGTVTIYEVIL